MAADNNLERFAIRNINQMELIGSTKNINVLVLIDRIGLYDSEDPTSAQLFRITKDKEEPNTIKSEFIADYGEVDMTDPNSLINFISSCN